MVKTTRDVHEKAASDHLGVSARQPQRHPPANDRRTVFGGIPVDEIISWLRPWLEPYLHKTVREEVNHAFSFSCGSSSRPPFNLSGSSGACNLELRFEGEVPRTLYHGNPIETVSGTPLQIVLVDCATREIVVSGPLSMLKLEIVVVNGEFGDDEREDWTVEDFNQSVVREREGKRPLLMGKMNMTLTGGVGTFGPVMFTDNSSWTRRKKFRLGARVLWRTSTETRVREAVSNPFGVKEHRGEKCKKHHPPFLHDEVWRLVQIRKDGPLHDRLRSHRIETVMDFLRHYEVDPSALKNILGQGMCTRRWNAIVSHANTCVMDDSKFYFCSEDVVLMFNSVYRVVAAAFGNLNHVPMESWTPHQKATVERLKTEAHRKWSEWLPVDAAANFAQNHQRNEPSTDFLVAHQGHQGEVAEPILLPASDKYEAMGLQLPGVIRPSRVLDPREDSHVLRGEQGYNTQAAEPEYIFRGGDEHCPWLPGSSSFSTLAERQPGLVNNDGGGMNSNRSSLTSLNTLGSTSTLPKVDYYVEEQPPHPQSDRTYV